MRTTLFLLIVLAFILPHQSGFPVTHADIDEVVMGYYSPCRFGTEGTVKTWHGVMQNGEPPYDPTRRTYDFRCQDKLIYAPHAGVVWGVTPRFGGVILIDDDSQDACMVFLGMHGFEVEPNQEVTTGTFLGFYGHAFHLSVLDGDCADANWYDFNARDLERPVQWIEFDTVIPPDIQAGEEWSFQSQNPGGSPLMKLFKIQWR